ncbi:MAG TPA: hypothetical protein VF138_10075 [Caulobacteraceae bacterium]
MSVEQITDGAADQREWNARVKLFGTIVNTYGFAALGGSLAEPLLKGQAFTLWNWAGSSWVSLPTAYPYIWLL